MPKKEQRESNYKLDHLIALMEKIAIPIPAIPAIAPIPAIPPLNNIDDNRLTRVEVKIDAIQASISELKDGTANRIGKLEQCKLEVEASYSALYKKDVDKALSDHEAAIKDLNSFKDTLSGKMWGIGIMAGVGSGLLMMIAQYVLNHLK